MNDQQFEAEHQAELARAAILEASLQEQPAIPVYRLPSRPPRRPSDEERRAAEVRAKEIVRKKYGVNPELPGWRGLVLAEMRALIGENDRPGR